MAKRRQAASPITRLNLTQLAQTTASYFPEIIKRANTQCHVIRNDYAVGSRDGFQRTYRKDRTFYNEMRVYMSCTDGKRASFIRFFGPPDKSTPCWVFCSCPYFCVDGGTLISTPVGLRPIQDTVGKLTTYTREGAQEAHTFATGDAPTLLLTTSDGFEIRATPNERFTVLTPELDQVWKRLDEIEPGDHVAMMPGAIWPEEPFIPSWTYRPATRGDYQRRIGGKLRNVKGHEVTGTLHTLPDSMTAELARLLGYLAAEGSGDRNTISFTQNEGAVLEDFRRCWESTFPATHLSESDAHTETGKQLECRSVHVSAFFKEALGHDPSLRHRTKKVPHAILRSTRVHVREFLRAYFEGDGTASTKQVSCSSTSKELAAGVQQLLFALGIRSSLTPHKPSPPYEANLQYRVTLSGHDASAFLDEVGFTVRKPSRAPSLGKHGCSYPHARKVLRACVQPNGFYVVEGNRVRLKLWDHKIFSAYYENGTTDSLTEYSLRRYMQGEYGQNLKQVAPETHQRLRHLLDNDVRWAQVKSVGGPKTVPTYDATVPVQEHFVANGFVVHNTYNLEVALTRQNTSSIKFSNGQLPRERNRRMVPHLCKHLVLAARLALQQTEDKAAARMQVEASAKSGAENQREAMQHPMDRRIPKGQFTSSPRKRGLIKIP